MPMSLKTGIVFLRAPPPTPATATFPRDGSSVFSESSSRTRSDDSGSILIYETESPTPDVVAFQVTEMAASDVSDSIIHGSSWVSGSFEFGTTESAPQTTEDGDEYLVQSNDGTSDAESTSSSQQGTPVFTLDFHQMVVDGVRVFRTQGSGPLIEFLLHSGVEDYQSAVPVALVTQAIIKDIIKSSQTEGKSLERALRAAAMEMFRQHWKLDGDWTAVSSTTHQPSYLTLRGINIAGFVGSLFDARISTAEDVSLCLSLLVEGTPHFDRLCAMHALLIQANDKLCKNRNKHSVLRFREAITVKDALSGRYMWAPSEHAFGLLQDILGTIDGWMATQTMKRERYKVNSMTHVPPKRAVGPRLRNTVLGAPEVSLE
ncbi:hypothetical protein BV22DRAFT_1126227 [Leucogyrophana mollusca]|uniref:Uncharacterized protein n=1 Tax=Leucogyrophana mollusca TaxID=85980 RepID=A0ACB8BSC6_9AGAM|nr:hypothetical protein BV22DRAFT_1126227 [Leucogyrophana mollusca]